MNVIDFMAVLAALVILITALFRLNDIKRTSNSFRWWVRRVGLLMVFVSMTMMISSYFTISSPYWNEIMRLVGLWGFALTWITTPRMPPWWKIISHYDPKVE